MTANILEFRRQPGINATPRLMFGTAVMEQIEKAPPAERERLVIHHFSRAIDEVAVTMQRNLDNWQLAEKASLHPSGRSIRGWLKQDFQGENFDRRILPALRGMAVMGHPRAANLNNRYNALRCNMRQLTKRACAPTTGQSRTERKLYDAGLLEDARDMLYAAVNLAHDGLQAIGKDFRLLGGGSAVLATALSVG